MGESKQPLYCGEIIYFGCVLCAAQGSFKCIFFHPDVAPCVESSHGDGPRALTLNGTRTNILLLSAELRIQDVASGEICTLFMPYYQRVLNAMHTIKEVKLLPLKHAILLWYFLFH